VWERGRESEEQEEQGTALVRRALWKDSLTDWLD
jgi:hypothetical protein